MSVELPSNGIGAESHSHLDIHVLSSLSKINRRDEEFLAIDNDALGVQSMKLIEN